MTSSAGSLPRLRTWVVRCAAAEALGISAGAGATGWAQDEAWWLAVTVIVAGGLVEGVALGTAQAQPLGRWLPGLRRRRYVVVTVLVAGLGWGLGSVGAVLGDDGTGTTGPSLVLVVLFSAGLGVAMGGLLGAAQAWALRGAVPQPWRWVGANLAAWPLAMAMIFVGAGLPGEDWHVAGVLATAGVTGALAGAVLGLVTWRFLPRLARPGANGSASVARARRLTSQLKRG